MTMESQAEALNQLTTDDLEGKFAMLESSSVDDDLESLKKELSGTSKVMEFADDGVFGLDEEEELVQQQQQYPIPPGQGMGEVKCRQIIPLPLTGKETASV
ncbi:probable membrane-associated 30 kDa protein, chloroplastic, partial [Tanacetum coccineum]